MNAPSSASAAPPVGPVLSVTKVPLPSGPPGIGFDDLMYSGALRKVITPAGRTGAVDLVDPESLDVSQITGFSASATYMFGYRDSGSTSADEGGGRIFANDHETKTLRVLDPTTMSTVAQVDLMAGGDYVRWTPPGEVWVTAPFSGIEVLTLAPNGVPVHAATIAIAGGPEALVVDGQRPVAYTNAFAGKTFAIDRNQRSVVETWTNGCALSLGLALDEARNFVFVACMAGSVVVLDATHNGAILGTLEVGAGVDGIAYSAALHHLYVPGGVSGDLSIVGISSMGVPTLLGSIATAAGSQGVAIDDEGDVFVGDPAGGQLLKIHDTFAMTP